MHNQYCGCGCCSEKVFIKKILQKGYLLSKSKKYTILVYTEKNIILGMGAISGNDIKRVFVDPKMHGKGIGRKIMDKLESIAKKKHIKELILHAYENAVPFYKKLGYRKIKPYYYDGPEGIRVKTIEMKKRL
jgi:GNAT superfamily N-acetyltransferase